MAKKKKKMGHAKEKKTVQHSTCSVVRDAYRFAQKQVAERNFSNPAFRASLDLDTVRTQRRIQATQAYTEQIRHRMLDKFPDLSGIQIEDDWAEVNSYPRAAYDAEEDMYTVTMAIAIWILDQLRDVNQLDKARAYLSTDAQRLSRVNAPFLWDPCHREDLILSMMDVIQSRNEDCVGKKKPEGTENEPPRLFMDLYTVVNIHKQDVPSRNRFEEILKLIPGEVKEKAAQAFTDKFWDFLEHYYQCRRIFVQQENQLDEDCMRHLDEARRSLPLLTGSKELPMQPTIGKMPVLLPDTFSNDFLHDSSFIRGNPLTEAVRIAMHLDAQQEELNNRRQILHEELSDLWFYFHMLYEVSYEDCVERFGKEIADVWKDFYIDDPYELSFGFLYLLDSGSELPWLYFPGVILFRWIASSLPWAHMDFNMDSARWEELTEILDMAGSEGYALPKKVKVPELENWYRMHYCDETDIAEEREKYNLAQIMYQITGGIMPRKPERYLYVLQELDNYGIKGKKALHPLYYCMSILGEASYQNGSWQPETQDPIVEVGEMPETDTRTTEELEKEIAVLRKENEQLRSSLYHTGCELRSIKKKQESADARISQERQELTDLRELVFHQQEGIYLDEKQTTGVTFPCRTTQRIVVFGGHDSWAREIKPKLPDVRFVDRTVLPNANMIRNADVIWIQTNALSHAYFYKIVEEVRKYNVPVRYFSYASAAKCAEQIVRADQDR